MTRVSIIMPVKNGEAYLIECLNSIIDQSYEHWELIIVDDHSTDATPYILQAFAKSDGRIFSYKNQGGGIIPALQLALTYAKSIYITRMDADDLMPPMRLEKMVKAQEASPKKTVVTGLVEYFSEAEISEGYKKYEGWLNRVNLESKQWQNIYRECVIASPNWMVSRADLLEMGGFNGLEYPEDYDLVFRWYMNQLRITVIPEVTLLWREHSKRTSRNSDDYNQKAFFTLKIRHFLALDLRSDSLIIWGNNPKTKLCTDLLNQAGQPFHEFDLKDFQKIETFEHSQLLVGVYPSAQEREKLENYLFALKLIEGRDWWYL